MGQRRTPVIVGSPYVDTEIGIADKKGGPPLRDTDTRKQIQACTHTHTHKHTNTQAHTQAHTQTHTQLLMLSAIYPLSMINFGDGSISRPHCPYPQRVWHMLSAFRRGMMGGSLNFPLKPVHFAPVDAKCMNPYSN